MMKMEAIKSLQTAAFVVAVALLAESSASADIPAEDNDYWDTTSRVDPTPTGVASPAVASFALSGTAWAKSTVLSFFRRKSATGMILLIK